MTDILTVVEKARSGDDSAFEILLKKYNSLLLSMARKYSDMCNTPSRQYDDFLQEAKMAFYNSVLTFNVDNGITFGAYAKICVRNRLVSCLRYATSKKRRKSNGDSEETSKSPQDTVIRRELEEKLLSLAENILSTYELRIYKMYIQGAKVKEISAKIGKDEKSVNNAIFRIRSKLKKQSNINT
jgi:RNA polymerase sporulation-specific sigma factor